MTDRHVGVTAKVVATFLDSRLTPLLLAGTLLAGLAGLLLTPREEEPQIIVPLVDVLIDYPGASPEEVERTAVIELENLVRGLPGVEHVYSEAREGAALVSVRFEVGHDRERALVDTFTRINANLDKVAAGVAGWLVRPVDIDDVPILTLALHGGGLTSSELRRIAEELADRVETIDDVALSTIVGGEPLAIEVVLDPERLGARRVAPLEVARALQGANAQSTVGTLRGDDRALALRAGPFLRGARDVEDVVVAVRGGQPVLLRDVAEVREGPLDPTSYVRVGFGAAAGVAGLMEEGESREPRPSVALALAKRKGANAVRVSRAILDEIEAARGEVLPDDVAVTVTRDDGASANQKVNELVEHIAVAVVTVVLVLLLGLGWREALIVAIAIPVTFAVALFADLLTGYTINRVTLFALVLSLGLLVDDPIVDVENIHRHLALRVRSKRDAVLFAVNEVRPPLILATMTVIVSFLPMFFITGMMGPYMAPMPFNISVVMLTSLVVALTITPWAALRLLREHGEHEAPSRAPRETLVGRVYSRLMEPLMRSRRAARGFLAAMVGALFVSAALPLVGGVPLKMLPFANKDRLQVTVDMPEGTALEATDAALGELAAFLLDEPDVTFVASYAGSASPHDFQGLVRHHFLRRGDHLGDLRIGLIGKDRREQSSHQVALRIRPRIEEIAARHGARVAIAEEPPGPPVLQTVVAEVRAPAGATWEEQVAVARDVRERLTAVRGAVDVDWMVAEEPLRPALSVDQERAALHGVTVDEVVSSLALAAGREPVTGVHMEGERHLLPVVPRLAPYRRARGADLEAVPLRYGDGGAPLTVGQLARLDHEPTPRGITRKDLERVVFVSADTAGISPADAVFALQGALAREPLPEGYSVGLGGEGEWKITLDVFRDLGLAFGAALLGIYVLLVGQTGSLLIPLVMMVAIPITAIGIFPGFWLINLVRQGQVGEYADPTWFTATAMIGMIALAGIVVRNSVILIDFIEVQLADGLALFDAVLEAGAVRFRPILLTASTALLGVWVMTLDPIFSGLAWSFIFGILASTAFTLIVVPLIYYMLHAKEAGEPPPSQTPPPERARRAWRGWREGIGPLLRRLRK